VEKIPIPQVEGIGYTFVTAVLNHSFESLWFTAVLRRKYSAMLLIDEFEHALS